jgi:putative DNA primase/helicase
MSEERDNVIPLGIKVEDFEPADQSTTYMTDLGNARRLVALYGEDIRYVHAWCQWLVWEDGQWRKDDSGAIIRLAKATVEQMFDEANGVANEDRRTALRKFALASQNIARLNAMIKLAESEPEVILPVKQIDADPYLLGVQNGVIELRTGTFRPARREDYITKRASPAFDLEAKCPQWEKFLKKIFPNRSKPAGGDLFTSDSDDEMIGYVQRVAGYVLTGLVVEEVLFVPWGVGSNGKTTLREILFALLGDYAMGSDASLLITKHKDDGGPTPSLVRLNGRRLVTINETQKNDFLNESRVKFITGNDIITARDLYERPFDFFPTHKTMLTTNHKPIVRGTDEGIWRRIHLWLFGTIIPVAERVQNFRVEVLVPELPGILNWAIAGTVKYLANGLMPPNSVVANTDKYRKDMDIVGKWIGERCTTEKGAWTSIGALCEDFRNWSGLKASPIGFGRDLSSRGYESEPRGRRSGYPLGLLPTTGEAQEPKEASPVPETEDEQSSDWGDDVPF